MIICQFLKKIESNRIERLLNKEEDKKYDFLFRPTIEQCQALLHKKWNFMNFENLKGENVDTDHRTYEFKINWII